MLRLLLLLGAFVCVADGRSRTVVVGEGERVTWRRGLLTKTIEASDCWEERPRPWLSSPLIVLGGVLNTSSSPDEDDGRMACLGIAGTGGGGSKISESGYVVIEGVDGDDAIVLCKVIRRIYEFMRYTSPTERSLVLDEPSILPRNAEVFALTEDFAGWK